MNNISNKRIAMLIATLLMVFVACGLVLAQPVSAKTVKKPAKVKNVKITTYYNAKVVEFGDDTNGYIAPVTVKWNKAKYAKKYQVAYKKSGAKSWTYKKLTSRSIKIQDYNLKSKNLVPGTQYQIKVRAINKTKKGKWSSIKKFTTKKVEYVQPGVVFGLKVVEKCDNSDVILKWHKIDNAEKYELAYKTGHNDWNSIISDTNTARACGLQPYAKYEFKVRAINGDKIGEWSEALSAMTRVNSVEIDFPTIANFAITNRGLGSLTMSWDADYSAYTKKIIDNKHIKYNVYASKDKLEWVQVADHIKETTYTQRYCDMGVTYFFKVVPVDNESYKEFDYSGEASEVISGKVQDSGVEVVVKYTDQNDEYIFNRSYNIRGLMLHSVGGNIEGAEEWYNLYNGKMKSDASVHGFIDGTTGFFLQTLDWGVRAGHAAAAGNNRYIGIEMCESRYLKYGNGGQFEVDDEHLEDAQAVARRTYDTAVKLFAYLCDYFGFDPLEKGTIVSHYEWGTEYEDMSGGGHLDPEHMWTKLETGYTMDGFRHAVADLLAQYQ